MDLYCYNSLETPTSTIQKDRDDYLSVSFCLPISAHGHDCHGRNSEFHALHDRPTNKMH